MEQLRECTEDYIAKEYIIEPVYMKLCTGCKTSKLHTEFYIDIHRKDKLSRLCKPCVVEYNKIHRERILQNKRRYYLKNKAKIDAWNKVYNRRRLDTKAGMATVLLSGARQRAKDRNRQFNLTFEHVLELVNTEVCTIPWCGKPIDYLVRGRVQWNSPSLDCLIPSKGYTIGNVALIHHRCNQRKQDLTPTELRALADWIDAKTGVVNHE